MSSYMPTSTSTTYGQPPATNQNQGNGLAVAALVLGILPTGVVGIIVGILGLVRAGKVGGKGRAMSWIGIILSILWIVGATAIVIVAASTVAKSANPGCVSAVLVAGDGSNFTNASGDPDAFKTELQKTIDGLNAAAAESTNAEATTAIKALAGDYQSLLDAVSGGQIPSSSLTTKLTTDAAAVDRACGI